MMMMMSFKKLVAMTKKWQRLVATTRSVAHKGHFVVYSKDKKRFVIPLVYLSSSVFGELLKMSEEEFGLPRDGPITLPCDAAFVEYVLVMVARRRISDELVSLMAVSSTTTSSSSSLIQCSSSDTAVFSGYDELCCSCSRQRSIHGF